MKTSLEYTELAGLRIALNNLELIEIVYQDEDWIATTTWIRNRIQELTNK